MIQQKKKVQMNDIQQRMKDFIAKYYMLNRVSVGDDTSMFVHDISVMLDAEILSVPSGTECLTWIIPEKWTVHKAYIETLNGKRIADFSKNPLYLKSHSAAYNGIVNRQELLKHIVYDQDRPESIIYDYRLQYKYGPKEEWGFSLPYKEMLKLNDAHYKVVIDTEFSIGNMDVLDLAIKGRLKDTIFLSAHTCHPAMVNDGIGCIAVLIELANWLKNKADLMYSYRIIMGPEFYAAAALLENSKEIKNLRYGIYLDMAGNNQKPGFSHSFTRKSWIDYCVKSVFESEISDYLEVGYRELWGNDEMFYDGPDFQIPTVCIGRDRFADYHTDKDNLENCNLQQLEDSFELLKKIIELAESDCIPVRNYRGPLYLSRFDVYIDPKIDQQGHGNLQKIQILMDGKKSCLEIAHELNIPYDFVVSFVNRLEKKGLVSLSRPSVRV